MISVLPTMRSDSLRRMALAQAFFAACKGFRPPFSVLRFFVTVVVEVVVGNSAVFQNSITWCAQGGIVIVEFMVLFCGSSRWRFHRNDRARLRAFRQW